MKNALRLLCLGGQPAVIGALVLMLAPMLVPTGALGQPAEAPSVPNYEFERPDAILQLPSYLREASGLATLSPDVIATIEDEQGRLYLLNAQSGAVTETKRFGPDGDFEALTNVGPRVFVLRSDGTLFDIADWRADSLSTRIHPSILNRRYDTEGLAYDAAQNRLLIACKEFAGPGLSRQKALYAFDLATETWLPEPVATIPTEQFNRRAEDSQLDRLLRSFLTPIIDVSGFKPSGLALHPQTGHWFLLSSGRSAIVELSSEGALLAIHMLPADVLPQPEGITFTPSGDLLVATEGGAGQAQIARFTLRE